MAVYTNVKLDSHNLNDLHGPFIVLDLRTTWGDDCACFKMRSHPKGETLVSCSSYLDGILQGLDSAAMKYQQPRVVSNINLISADWISVIDFAF